LAKPLKVNLLHALEDFLEAYPYAPPEVALVEGISNSIDADASKIQIWLDDEELEFSLLDNGGGMSEEDFENYHTVALSSKKKGQGIGFAGVGSKIYLAASPEAVITTETLGPDGPLASVIRREPTDQGYDELVYDDVKCSLKSRGTRYTVKMSKVHFKELEQNAEEWIVKWFNQILSDGSRAILLEGSSIKAWKPKLAFSQVKKFEVRGVKFQVAIFNTKDKLDPEMVGLNTVVFGKFVKKYDFPWQYQLKKDARDTIYAVLNADPLSEYLSLNKLEFKGSHLVHSVVEKANAEVFELLQKKGLIVPVEEEPASQIFTNALTNSFTKLLFSSAFKKFNPWITVRNVDSLIPNQEGGVMGAMASGAQLTGGTFGGEGLGGGVRVSGSEDGEALSPDDGGDVPGEERKRRVKTVGIAFVELPGDPKEGWVDAGQKAIVVNTGHMMYRKLVVQNDITAINLNILRVLVTAVLEYKKEELPELTPENLLKIQSEMIANTWVNV
jgi:hypothetical protein